MGGIEPLARGLEVTKVPEGMCPVAWVLGRRSLLCARRDSISRFYEKVIKVKADVAAFLISCFPFHLSIGITLRW